MNKQPSQQSLPSMVVLPYLRAWRVEKGMSMHQLAEAAKVSTNTLQRLETGGTRAYAQTIVKLARALKISPRALVEINPEDVSGVETGAA